MESCKESKQGKRERDCVLNTFMDGSSFKLTGSSSLPLLNSKQELHHYIDYIALLERKTKEADDYIATLESQKENILFRNYIITCQIDELTKEIKKMRESRSWRITAPLRYLIGHIRRLFSYKEQINNGNKDVVWPPCVQAIEKKIQLKSGEDQISTPIGVFMHIYYVELAKEMLICVNNLPQTAQIHISTNTEEKQRAIQTLFAEAGFMERTIIRVCPNKGWDIAPFLVGFAQEIPRYPLILRLHSKRSTHIPGSTGDDWRRMLFSSLAGSVGRVNAVLKAFNDDPHLGMICPPSHSYLAHIIDYGKNFHLMQYLLHKYGVNILPDTPIDFPVGAMFWCRSNVLSPWLNRHFSYDDFAPTTYDERDGSLAHAMERLFLFGCGITGFSWARLNTFPQ